MICLITSSYSGNNIDLKDKLQSFVSEKNAKFGEVPYDFQYVWNSIFGQISNNRKIIISTRYNSSSNCFKKKI